MLTESEISRVHLDLDGPVMVSVDGGKTYHVCLGYDGKTVRQMLVGIKQDALENVAPAGWPEWMDKPGGDYGE